MTPNLKLKSAILYKFGSQCNFAKEVGESELLISQVKYEENHKHQPSYKTCKQYFIDDIRSRFGDDTLISNIRYVDLETYRNHLMNRTFGTFV